MLARRGLQTAATEDQVLKNASRLLKLGLSTHRLSGNSTAFDEVWSVLGAHRVARRLDVGPDPRRVLHGLQTERLGQTDAMRNQPTRLITRVGYQPDGSYDISPEALKRHVESLPAPTTASIRYDVLIHNPETLCSVESSLEEQNQVLLTNLKRSFAVLEDLFHQYPARLQAYGVTSAGFSAAPSPRDKLARPTAEILEKAEPGQHFQLIQTPGNVIERFGLEGPSSIASWARGKGLDVLVHRPLTAFEATGESWRLAEAEFPPGYTSAKEALLGHVAPGSPEELDEAQRWMKGLIESIDVQIADFTSIVHWETELTEKIIPLIEGAFEEVDEDTVNLTTAFLKQAGLAVRESGGYRARLRSGLPDQGRPLERQALEWVLDHPNATCVLPSVSRAGQVEKWIEWWGPPSA